MKLIFHSSSLTVAVERVFLCGLDAASVRPPSDILRQHGWSVEIFRNIARSGDDLRLDTRMDASLWLTGHAVCAFTLCRLTLTMSSALIASEYPVEHHGTASAPKHNVATKPLQLPADWFLMDRMPAQ